MTTYNHTAIATGAAATAAIINSPLAELDAAIKKNEYAKTAAPTANDDSGDGYSVGSMWVDTTNDKVYICVDATATAAIWYRVDIGNREILLGPQDLYTIAGSPAQGALGQQPTWRLDDSATETIGAAAWYPGPIGGSTIKVLVIWAMESATANEVYFTVTAAAIADGETAAASGTGSSAATTVPGTAQLTEQTEWTCAEAYVAGDLIQVSISRVGGDAGDDATGDCHILAAVLRFE